MGIRQNAKKHGKTKYNSGKSCAQGHISDRSVATGKCLACVKEDDKKHKLFKKYGLRNSEYFELFWKQSGTCAICREKEIVINTNTKEPVALSVDHCHNTGKIRGLLCQRCNIGIGNLKHDPQLLRIAALYCEKD